MPARYKGPVRSSEGVLAGRMGPQALASEYYRIQCNRAEDGHLEGRDLSHTAESHQPQPAGSLLLQLNWALLQNCSVVPALLQIRDTLYRRNPSSLTFGIPEGNSEIQ